MTAEQNAWKLVGKVIWGTQESVVALLCMLNVSYIVFVMGSHTQIDNVWSF